MSEGLRTVRVRVSGCVQGVLYRASTQQQAQQHGLRGWVRNLPDGDVEALLSGPASQVEAMLTWMRRGPAAARVDQLVIEEGSEDARAHLSADFEVRR